MNYRCEGLSCLAHLLRGGGFLAGLGAGFVQVLDESCQLPPLLFSLLFGEQGIVKFVVLLRLLGVRPQMRRRR